MRILRFLSAILATFLFLVGAASVAQAQVDYNDVTIIGASTALQDDNSIIVTLELDPLFEVGSVATISDANGTLVNFVVGADGTAVVTLPAGFGARVTVNGTSVSGASLVGTTVLDIVDSAVTTPTAVPTTNVAATPTVETVVLGATVVPTSTSVPSVPLAVTGGNSRAPVAFGVVLLGVGGLALFAARRRQLSA